MTNHAAEIAITGLVIATLKMKNPEHILLTWCAIKSVPKGLMIYNTTTKKQNFYNGSAWKTVTSL
jgi:hypothetical protein